MAEIGRQRSLDVFVRKVQRLVEQALGLQSTVSVLRRREKGKTNYHNRLNGIYFSSHYSSLSFQFLV